MLASRLPLLVVTACLPIPRVAAIPNCPLSGFDLPPPENLSEHPYFAQALANLTTVFQWLDLDYNGTTGASNYSYSSQVFSANPGKPILWERYHTATNLPTLNSSGVTEVDENTVYRLGSLTKVFTVLAYLAQDGDVHWNEPITKYVPEVAELSERSKGKRNALWDVDWEDITLGALASQVSGIARDYGVLGEITQTINSNYSRLLGFPPLEEDEQMKCGAWPLCNRTEFFEGVATLPVTFKPSATPAYSNIAYQLLAYALEAIADKPYHEILNDTVLLPLNLTNTYYWWANQSVGIIPGTAADAYWNVFLGDASPGGNMFSSAKDITTLGLSILGNTLIKPAITRRWLKPMAYSADLYAAVGAPWGLRRVPIGTNNPGRSLTVFNKAGRIRWYSTLLTLIPEWNIGFTILQAGNLSGSSSFDFADFLGTTLIPAYDYVARDQAMARYGGNYRLKDITNSTSTWSWMKISTNATRPGLGVDEWYSAGVNMIDYAARLQTGIDLPGLQNAVRLYYTGLEHTEEDGTRKVAFKAVFEDVGIPDRTGPKMFSTDCAAWLGLTGVTYGGWPLDEFVFEVDGTGRAVAVENLGLRVELVRI